MLPIPSICAINGHAFGAGFMFSLAHDLRFMRSDRGYLCANEIEIGMLIPDPEIALFKHKLPAHIFFETVQLAPEDGLVLLLPTLALFIKTQTQIV